MAFTIFLLHSFTSLPDQRLECRGSTINTPIDRRCEYVPPCGGTRSRLLYTLMEWVYGKMSVQLSRPNSLPSALHVADYMLATAKLDYGLDLDQLQLNKLLHITNGFVLQKRDDPAFHNDVEAWKYGPVIRIVWETYRDWSDHPIGTLAMCRTPLSNTDAAVGRRAEILGIIGRDVASVVGGVLRKYGRCTGTKLTAMTHRKGTPWSKSYRRGYDVVIPTKTISEFYRNLSKHDDGR